MPRYLTYPGRAERYLPYTEAAEEAAPLSWPADALLPIHHEHTASDGDVVSNAGVKMWAAMSTLDRNNTYACTAVPYGKASIVLY